MSMRRRVFEVFEVAKPGDSLSRTFDVFIMTLIGLNVIALILASVENMSSSYGAFFSGFELFSVAVFSVEYIFRVWSCVENARYRKAISGRVRFVFTPLALIDLLAVLPFYLPFVGVDLRFIRIFRMMRITRIAKLGRYSESIQLLLRVLSAKREQLVSSVFILFLLLIIAASMMYYVENGAQPENFSSIPATMWWAVATLTTVGYGDVYPVTQLGKLLGSVIAILGIGMFALPTGILGAGFVEEIDGKKTVTRCPHCEREIGEDL